MVDHILTKPITAADVAEHDTREIIRGEWAEEIELAGQKHGLIVQRMLSILDAFVTEHQLGEVYPDTTTYVLEGTSQKIITQRMPDVSFVAEARVDRENTGLMYLAPDLAIEVVSPNERAGCTASKVPDYLRFKTKQVWVIDPAAQHITIHTLDKRITVLGIEDTVLADKLLPNFEMKVADIFDVIIHESTI